MSDKQESMTNGKQVIGIAKPIMDEQQNLNNILVAYLRVDYLLNIMKILSPNTNISISNAKKDIIMSINETISPDSPIFSLPIDRLPWEIIVEIKQPNIIHLIKKSTLLLLFFLLCSHLFYFIFLLYKHRKNLEKETKQNEIQKLELVGNLAASSAHEIRNPLTGIKGLVQLLSEKHKDEQDQFYFSIIQKEIIRINEIVSQFLILGKPTALKKQIIDLQNIIAELKPLIISEANLYNVECIFTIPTNTIPVHCTADQMKQVLLNITKNALEAMENGGELQISMSISEEEVIITITDTGVGISNEQLKKLFEPFYTSKTTGTGLGLIVCKRIIQSFNGEIFISSKEMKGTKVDILLPLNRSAYN
jgi:two-component system, sporulation sensor kinase D